MLAEDLGRPGRSHGMAAGRAAPDPVKLAEGIHAGIVTWRSLPFRELAVTIRPPEVIMPNEQSITVYPAAAERWPDLEKLFGPRGAYSNCWCMFRRLRSAEFNRMTGEERKAALHALTKREVAPGLLAYLDGEPAGWVSIGPRPDFAMLERSRVLKRVDDTPVWTIVCFFIAKPYRRQGLMTALLRAAVEYARQHGAPAVEAHPLDLHSELLEGKTLKGYSGFTGIAAVFRQAGFEQVGQASETQLIMRYTFR